MLKSIHSPISISLQKDSMYHVNLILLYHLRLFMNVQVIDQTSSKLNRDSVWLTQPYWSNKTKSLQYVVLAISGVDFSVHVCNFLKCFGLLEIAEIFRSIVDLPGTQVFLNLVLQMNCNVLYTHYFNGAIYIIMLRFWVIYEVIIIIY